MADALAAIRPVRALLLALIAAVGASRFADISLFTIDDVFGGWQNARPVHFADGGISDQIYRPGR